MYLIRGILAFLVPGGTLSMPVDTGLVPSGGSLG